MASFDQQGPAGGNSFRVMKNARGRQPNEGDASKAFSSPSWTRTSGTFKGFPQKEKSFDVLVRLRWAMKNAWVPGAPVWLTAFPRFSSPC
jgi:hypothetical protein